jgi:hypothetical protein
MELEEFTEYLQNEKKVNYFEEIEPKIHNMII